MGNLVQTAAREGARIGSGLQKSGSVPNLLFSSAEADTVKTEVITIASLSDKQDCHSNLLHRNCLHGIRRGDGPGSIHFFMYKLIRCLAVTLQTLSVSLGQHRCHFKYQPYINDSYCTTATTYDPILFRSMEAYMRPLKNEQGYALVFMTLMTFCS